MSAVRVVPAGTRLFLTWITSSTDQEGRFAISTAGVDQALRFHTLDEIKRFLSNYGILDYFYVARVGTKTKPIFLLSAREHLGERILALIDTKTGAYTIHSDNPELEEAYLLAAALLEGSNVVSVDFMSVSEVLELTEKHQ